MNTLENKMVDLLLDLKKNNGVVALKAEFETEAVRMNEMMRLKEVVERAGLGLIIKIGGAEAITDMFEAQHIGVVGLVAPMIESTYATTKYLEAIQKYFSEDTRKEIIFGINVETYQGYQKLEEILKLKQIKLLTTITLGRVDMTGSLGIGRKEINSDKMYEIAEKMFAMAKKNGFKTAIGGGISAEAIPFIKKLVSKKLLDRYETRKIVFNVPKNFRTMEKGIRKANMFELLWLENKKNYYSNICHEDDSRIEMLKKRV
jgi:4-hydroxy-2-oxoheptanedioate aldolase